MQQCKLVYFFLSSRGPPSPAGPPGEVDDPTLPYPKHDSACAAAHAPHISARQGHQCRQLCTPLSLALSNSDPKPGHALATAQAPTLVPHQRRQLAHAALPGRARLRSQAWSCTNDSATLVMRQSAAPALLPCGGPPALAAVHAQDDRRAPAGAHAFCGALDSVAQQLRCVLVLYAQLST